MLNLVSSASTKLYYVRDVVNRKLLSKVGHLQLALVVRRKTKPTDVFNVLLS